MAKVGRPKWIPNDKTLKDVEAMASRGSTNKEIALCLGISHDTLYAKKRQYKQFSDAIELGRAKGALKINNKMFEKAMDGDFQALSKIQNRLSPEWRENQVIEVHEAPKTFADLYKEQLSPSDNSEEDNDPNMKCN